MKYFINNRPRHIVNYLALPSISESLEVAFKASFVRIFSIDRRISAKISSTSINLKEFLSNVNSEPIIFSASLTSFSLNSLFL